MVWLCQHVYHDYAVITTYLYDRVDDAIHAFEQEATLDRDWIKARLALAKIYLQQGARQEGADQYVLIINPAG